MTAAEAKAGALVFVTIISGGNLEYVNVFSQPGGQTAGGEYVGTVTEGQDVGTLTGQTRSIGGVAWAEVTLNTPLQKGGRTFTTGWITLAPVSLRPVLVEYYASNATGGDVNRRSTPEYKSGNVLNPPLKNGAFAGKSDGTERNGYVKLTNSGQTYWVSKNYLRAAPAQPTPPKTIPQILETTVGNVTSTPGLLTSLKWIGIGILAIVVGAMIAAFTEDKD